MKMGELIDELLQSEHSVWLKVICENTPPGMMKILRRGEVNRYNMWEFCAGLVQQIRYDMIECGIYEDSVDIRKRGKLFLDQIWKQVKDLGIEKEFIFQPISALDVYVQLGLEIPEDLTFISPDAVCVPTFDELDTSSAIVVQ